MLHLFASTAAQNEQWLFVSLVATVGSATHLEGEGEQIDI